MVRWVHPSVADWADADGYAPEQRLRTQAAVPLAGAAALGGFVSGFFGWPTGLLHLLALYHLVERVFPWLSLRAERARLEGPNGLLRITLTPELVVIERRFDEAAPEPTASSYRWEELLGYYPSPHALVLCVADSGRLLLPRAQFSDVEWGLLEDLLRHRLGLPRPASSRALLRPLGVSLVVLVLWAFWQAQF